MSFPAELGPLAFLVALVAGAASFLSPCILPLLPAYLSFVSGLSVPELQASGQRLLLGPLGFVAGFTVVFTLLGAGLSLLGDVAPDPLLLRLIAGGLLMLLGLMIAADAMPHFLGRDARPLLGRRLQLGRVPRSPAGAFALGAAFAMGWTPCVGPVLAAILALALSGANPAGGAALLFVYSLGLGIPFVLAGFFATRALRIIVRLRQRARTVQVVCGAILVVYGVLLLVGWLGWSSGFLPDWVLL